MLCSTGTESRRWTPRWLPCSAGASSSPPCAGSGAPCGGGWTVEGEGDRLPGVQSERGVGQTEGCALARLAALPVGVVAEGAQRVCGGAVGAVGAVGVVVQSGDAMAREGERERAATHDAGDPIVTLGQYRPPVNVMPAMGHFAGSARGPGTGPGAPGASRSSPWSWTRCPPAPRWLLPVPATPPWLPVATHATCSRTAAVRAAALVLGVVDIAMMVISRTELVVFFFKDAVPESAPLKKLKRQTFVVRRRLCVRVGARVRGQQKLLRRRPSVAPRC